MIAIEDFGDFFEAVHGAGRRPFAWQEDLLRRLVDTGTWPEQIIAPTGAGKSSVVEIHVFAVALFAVGAAQSLPRRLAVVVNRRALTDSHAVHAERIRRLLDEAPVDDSVLGRVRDALVGLRPTPMTGPRWSPPRCGERRPPTELGSTPRRPARCCA